MEKMVPISQIIFLNRGGSQTEGLKILSMQSEYFMILFFEIMYVCIIKIQKNENIFICTWG